MNSMQIDCFLKAAKHRSFSVAASHLFVSQSTLSRNISLLEKELGITLFHRNSFSGIELTPAGRIMMESFSDIRTRLIHSLEKAQREETENIIHMTLGLLEGQLLDDSLNDMITAFKLEYPNIRIHIRRDTYQALMTGLESGDICVVCMPDWQFPPHGKIHRQRICMVDTILVVPKKLMKDVENRIYSIREFAALPFITLDETESRQNRYMLLQLFDACRISPEMIVCSTIQEQIQSVEMGEGVTIINPFNAICYSPTVNCVPIKELEPQPFSVAWNSSSSLKSVTCFHEFAKRYSNRT